jgi:medium-chain acyl-[acyl-carrier-protein] hydrolase
VNLLWSGHFPIHTYELDPWQRLAAPALLGFLMEAAGNNADALGFSIPQLAARNLTWMLSRLRLRLRELPGWRADLVVETWPSGLSRLFALRDFRLRLYGRAIGEAASAWLLIDTVRRRPVRPENAADWSGMIRPERVSAADLERLAAFPDAPGGGGRETELTVRYNDLDVNLHATSLRYAEWLLESLPADLLASSVPCELDLDFQNEAGVGERILSRSTPLGSGAFAHSLVRLADGVEVARARTAWRPAEPAVPIS